MLRVADLLETEKEQLTRYALRSRAAFGRAYG
ncbi:hypothetical protein BH20VER2_BH20VER2_02050 [soil metagenome]